MKKIIFVILFLILISGIYYYIGNNKLITIKNNIDTKSTSENSNDAQKNHVLKNCESGISEITLSNGQTWSCLNLGATTVWDGISIAKDCDTSSKDCNSSLTWIGKYYQWGSKNDSWNYSNYQSDLNWSINGTTSTGTTWNNTDKQNQILMQGPCNTGRHVPTINEWRIALNSILGSDNDLYTFIKNPPSNEKLQKLQSVLKLPASGYRKDSVGAYVNQGLSGNYMSSINNQYVVYNLGFQNNMLFLFVGDKQLGGSVRCLKD